MKTLEDLIKEFNLLYTDTLTRDNFCRVGFDSKKELVNLKNSITLYKLISEFNKNYNEFIADYNALDKFDFKEYIEIIGFRKRDNYKELWIWAPDVIGKGDSIIKMVEKDNQIFTICTNDANSEYEKYYCTKLAYDKNKVKAYLDLFEKYEKFLNQYKYLKHQMIFGDGCTTMFSKIEGELLENLNTFKVCLGNNYFNTYDFIEIFVNLGKDIEIDYSKVDLDINTIDEQTKKEDAEKILKKVYINKKRLEKRF